jgi:hypothetical protein
MKNFCRATNYMVIDFFKTLFFFPLLLLVSILLVLRKTYAEFFDLKEIDREREQRESAEQLCVNKFLLYILLVFFQSIRDKLPEFYEFIVYEIVTMMMIEENENFHFIRSMFMSWNLHKF